MYNRELAVSASARATVLRGFVGNAVRYSQRQHCRMNDAHTFGESFNIFAIIADDNDVSDLDKWPTLSLALLKTGTTTNTISNQIGGPFGQRSYYLHFPWLCVCAEVLDDDHW